MNRERKEKIQFLLARYVDGKASQKEKELLFELFNEETQHNEWEAIVEEMIAAEPESKNYVPREWQNIADHILKENPVSKSRVVRMPAFVRLVAAVILGVVLLGGAYLLLNKKENTEIVQTDQPTQESIDVPPGGDKAILILADGTRIILDSANNGAVAQQGGIKVIKSGGQVSYDPSGTSDQGAALFNTISTPKGGQYQLVLADGTRVWLNSASSLRFPAAFTSGDRVVELTGEGYFEVSHNPEKPFHVRLNNMDVQVLGTHFNINSYTDEPTAKTTLLEGKVKVSASGSSRTITPGQQTQLSKDGQLSVRNNVDLEEVMAWKNGFFSFRDADIYTLMRQLARWYDVEVEFQPGVPNRKFTGSIGRGLTLSEVLEGLQLTKVHYKISGKKIVLLP